MLGRSFWSSWPTCQSHVNESVSRWSRHRGPTWQQISARAGKRRLATWAHLSALGWLTRLARGHLGRLKGGFGPRWALFFMISILFMIFYFLFHIKNFQISIRCWVETQIKWINQNSYHDARFILFIYSLTNLFLWVNTSYSIINERISHSNRYGF